MATADDEYDHSRSATAPLVLLITEQNTTIDSAKSDTVAKQLKSAKNDVISTKRRQQIINRDVLNNRLEDKQLKRQHQELCHRGSSTWLTTLPLAEHSFNLNKQDFRDALALRYLLPMKEIPMNCACGHKNDIEHCLSCPLGGYVYLRHNSIRDLTANLLQMTRCKNIQIEPPLLPLTVEVFQYKSTITANDARLDIGATGVWSPMMKTLCDIRVFNSLAPSNASLSVEDALRKHEQEKIRAYGERVLQVEKCAFSPLIFSTNGVMGPEAEKFYSQIARLISLKTKQSYSDSIRYIRQRLSFSLLKTIIVSRRGFRGTKTTRVTDETDYNLLYITDYC